MDLTLQSLHHGLILPKSEGLPIHTNSMLLVIEPDTVTFVAVMFCTCDVISSSISPLRTTPGEFFEILKVHTNTTQRQVESKRFELLAKPLEGLYKTMSILYELLLPLFSNIWNLRRCLPEKDVLSVAVLLKGDSSRLELLVVIISQSGLIFRMPRAYFSCVPGSAFNTGVSDWTVAWRWWDIQSALGRSWWTYNELTSNNEAWLKHLRVSHGEVETESIIIGFMIIGGGAGGCRRRNWEKTLDFKKIKN